MPAHALVWFKRDLRLRDHAALSAATACDSAAGLYVIEPEWLASPEFDAQHLAFTLDCLTELRAGLSARGLPLLVRVGTLPQVFDDLRREFAFTHLLSHEETGPGWTYARDKTVARWCRARGVRWREWPQNGVVRPLRSRNGWAARWAARMNAAELPVPVGFAGAALEVTDLPTLASLASPGLAPHGRTIQRAGEGAAWAVLDGFVQGRARGYRRALSSPLTAEEGCSRLSPHLAFGTVSLRSVHHATEAAIAAARAPADAADTSTAITAAPTNAEDRALAYALRGFAGRLRWHCHFMQKLEDEPAIEHRNFARVFDGLRPGDGVPMTDADHARFEAWCAGATGFPMVDACMRSLRATGWLNFRMRAMLVSFASNHLWLHWRETGLFLARQFLDFEPGIHWSQMQMQSGTTGINTLRIYSPAKQAKDHDPQGEFVRRWVPEFGGADYPKPIVDERAALKAAKDKLYGLRKTPQALAEADAVQAKHGSRKSGLPPQRAPKAGANKHRKPREAATADPAQAELF
jgi:deoxyribodipyrimidine photo-lyase